MLGRTGFLQAVNRERLIAAAIAAAMAAIIGLFALAPVSAHASGGCTDSWTNAEGGSWFTGSDWSKGAPPTSEEEACITTNGTYTVTMTQNSGTVSIKSLTLGGTSGTQTLAVGSSCSVNAVLTTTAGIGIGAQGALTMTNGDGCGDSVTLSSPVVNAGKLTSEPANGGSRTLQGNLTNTGTVAINTNTAYSGTSTLLKNEGAIDLAEAKELTVSNKSTLENGTGGSIAATGTGNVLMSSTTFTEGAGTTSGTLPVIVDDGALGYIAGGGKSLIALRGTSTLSGNLAAGQALAIQSTCSENVTVTAAASFSSGGAITMTNGDGCGDSTTLAVSAGTLANSGTITTETDHGGSRTLQGNLTNTGTLAIDANTAYNGTSALLSNEGALDLGEGKELTVSNKGALTNGAGGSIVQTVSGNVLLSSGTTFTEGAGTTSGPEPVLVDDGTLDYTGAGASQIALRGTSALSGNLAAGQSLAIQSTCSENVTATAAASFTNAGTITMTNGDGCGNNADFAISAGTLTNSGKIVTETDHGGSRQIQGNVTNTGTLALNSFVGYNGTDAALNNEGALEIAEGKQLTVSNGGSVTNGTGGQISAATGADLLANSGTSFTEGAGTTSGGEPVIVDDGTLSYTGAGASQIALRGSSTLKGNLSAGQALSIQSTCGENATVTAAASFTNGGTITLTNGDGCGNNATLTVPSGETMTNSGKIIAEPDHGGTRNIQGNLTNTGSLVLNTNTSDTASGATLQNLGAIDIATGVSFSLTGGETFTNGPGGVISAAGTGSLVQTTGTFNQGLGTALGGAPVILDDLALHYTEHGAGTLALRGSSTVSGNVKVNETLLIESTCSENAVVTAAASFINNGIIELTNGDGCGNNATLNMHGETLTDTGTINVGNPHGGGRTIEGNLINSGIVLLNAGETLKVTGSYTQTSLAKLKTVITGASDFGALAVTGASTLAGKLNLIQSPTFTGSLGQKFPIITSGSLTGTFALESEGKLNASGLYYEPTYSTTGVTLVVTQATLKVTPNSGAPGATATVSGSGFLPGDTIELKFSDHHEVKTFYPSVTVNGSGEFSTEITIPATAALKGGEVKATSAQTGAKISAGFTVT